MRGSEYFWAGLDLGFEVYLFKMGPQERFLHQILTKKCDFGWTQSLLTLLEGDPSQSVGVMNSYGAAMSFLANLLQTAVQAFFDFSGLGFIQELTVILSRLGSNPIGRSRALTPRRERKFLLNIMTFFRRTVWFLAFSSIYLVSPSLGLITVGSK